MVKIIPSIFAVAVALEESDDSGLLAVRGSASKLLQEQSDSKEPQVSKTLALMSVLGAQPSAQQAQSLIEEYVSEAVHTGTTIDDASRKALQTLKNLIVGTTQQVIFANHETDQTALDTHANALAECQSTYKKDVADDAKSHANMTKYRDMHQKCRCEAEALALKKLPTCAAVDSYSFSCSSLGNPPINSGRKAWFAKAKRWLSEQEEELDDLIEACETVTSDYDKKLKECNKLQAEYESGLCTQRVEVHSTCHTYDTCFAKQRALLISTKDAVQDNEVARHVDFHATEQVKCFIDVLLHGAPDKGNNTLGTASSDTEALNHKRIKEFKKCKDKGDDVYDDKKNELDSVSKLTIKYPGIPGVPLPCDQLGTVAVYPGAMSFEGHYVWPKGSEKVCGVLKGLPKDMHALTDVTECRPLPLHLTKYLQGQVLLMKVKTAALHYSSPYWTNDALLNPSSAPDADEDAKYAAFVHTPFKWFKMCVGGPSENCFVHDLPKGMEASTAKKLFSGGFVRDTSIDREAVIESFGVPRGSYLICPMQKPGFNAVCRDGNYVRWGFCINGQHGNQNCKANSHDNSDSDAVIGIGLRGQNTGNQGAGWTYYFTKNRKATVKSVWFYALTGTSPSVLVAKLSSKGSTMWNYDSNYWTNDALYNDGQAEEKDDNAKYRSFISTGFKTMKFCMHAPEGDEDAKCVVHELAKSYSSAKALFNAGFVRESKLDAKEIIEAFGVAKDSYMICPMQKPGFNVVCRDGNRARWGYCTNEQYWASTDAKMKQSNGCLRHSNDNHDSDAVIGIGLNGQSHGGQNAGWTYYFTHKNRATAGNKKGSVSVWLYVVPN